MEFQNIHLIKKLFNAFERYDIDDIYNLIKKGVDINAQNKEGDTVLMLAAEHGKVEIVEMLLEEGVYVNIRNNQNYTALMLASLNGYTKIASMLIDVDANINIVTFGNDTALLLAVENNHISTVKLLLNNGAELADEYEELVISCKKGYVEILKLLLELDVTVDFYDNTVYEYEYEHNNNMTLLMIACENNQKDIVRLLLDKGATVFNVQQYTYPVYPFNNGEYYNGEYYNVATNAFRYAFNNVEIFKMLLDSIASFNIASFNNNSMDIHRYELLKSAICQNKTEIVKLLLNKKVNLNKDAYIIETPNGYTECIYHKKPTVIMLAVSHASPEIVKLLIDSGAEINYKTEEKNTALDFAITRGNREILKLLIDAKVEISEFVKNMDNEKSMIQDIMITKLQKQIYQLEEEIESIYNFAKIKYIKNYPTLNYDNNKLDNNELCDYINSLNRLDIKEIQNLLNGYYLIDMDNVKSILKEQDVHNLQKYIDQLNEKIEILYQPGNIGYQKTKHHFELGV